LNQAANLNWSPDSKWIVHEEVESFGTGAGWSVKAVWAAAPDGSQIRKIYDAPESSGGEIVTGWRADDTFAVYTWFVGGPQNPRFVNLDSGLVTLIYSGTFDMLAIDPQTGSTLYWLDYFNASQHNVKNGLYFNSQFGGSPRYIDASGWGQIDWVPDARTFYVSQSGGGVLAVNSHSPIHFDQESRTPAASPDGKWLAFWGNSQYRQQHDGVRIYALSGELIREVTTDAVDFVTWQPDGTQLFYIADGTLYAVQLPDGQPVPIDQGARVSIEGGLGWVQP
jgi:Tol biopolymer transport system component